MNIVIPAAGKGSRFANAGYSVPKPLISIDNSTMLVRAIDSLNIKGQYYILIQRDKFSDTIIDSISSVIPDAVILTIDYYTAGAAESVLLFKKFINTDEELFVANCDQIMNWNSRDALSYLRNFDAGIVTVNSIDTKHSFVEIDEIGLAKRLAEKDPISNNALTGLHYWKKGCYFVSSAESMIRKKQYTKNEFYVAPTYNELIDQGKQIGVYSINQNQIDFVGTPEDLEIYETRKN